MAHMKGMKMDGMPSDQMPGMQGMQKSDNSMPGMKDMDMSGMKDGNTSAMSRAHMDEHTGAFNESAGITPLPQPGPSTTRLLPPPSQTMSRPIQTLEGEVPLHIGPEVVGVAMQTSPQLHDAGDGLNGNGRRVLTYADLRALYRVLTVGLRLAKSASTSLAIWSGLSGASTGASCRRLSQSI
jgi:hypothetical protein